jgi:hypothetical protein
VGLGGVSPFASAPGAAGGVGLVLVSSVSAMHPK